MTAREIFLQAIELSDRVEQKALVDASCSDDERLKEKVLALIEAHEEPASLLDKPLVVNDATELHEPAFAENSVTEGPGSTIGPYKLLQEIGQGGFGVVYMAEQQELVRVRLL